MTARDAVTARGETEIAIQSENDIVLARQRVREAAQALGFESADTTRIVTAASELVRNLFEYAGGGVMTVRLLTASDPAGIELQFVDQGPGIPSVEQALAEGYSTSGGLGLGLPGARKLMDEMNIQSVMGQGTTITVRKWRRG